MFSLAIYNSPPESVMQSCLLRFVFDFADSAGLFSIRTDGFLSGLIISIHRLGTYTHSNKKRS